MPKGVGTPTSWGAPPLTARPEGLLSSLGIQSGGKYPQHLLSDLQPTYDLGFWYREYNQIFSTVAIPSTPYACTTATDYDLGIQVPDGELWVVNRIGVKLNVTGGVGTDSFNWTILRTNNADGTQLPLMRTQLSPTSTAAGSFPALLTGCLEFGPILLRASVKLRWRLVNRTTGIHTLQSGECSVAYTRCLI